MRAVRFTLLLSALAVVTILAHAQTKVSTLPISRDVVVLRVAVGQAAPARVVALNGGMIRLAVRNGPTLALVPVLREGGVAVAVMDVVTNPATGGETAKLLAKANVALGSSVEYNDTRLSMEVGLTEVRSPASDGAVESSDRCTTCCVTCGDLTVCSCGVEMECGRCCCPAGGCGCDLESPASSACEVPYGSAVPNLKRRSR